MDTLGDTLLLLADHFNCNSRLRMSFYRKSPFGMPLKSALVDEWQHSRATSKTARVRLHV